MAGLREALLARGVQPGSPDGPAFVQRSDPELLAQMDAFARDGRLQAYGYGGDVDGKDAEGVGGSDRSGDWGDGTSGADIGGISDAMGNYGEAHGYGRDFSGPGDSDRGFMGYSGAEFGPGGSWGGYTPGATDFSAYGDMIDNYMGDPSNFGSGGMDFGLGSPGATMFAGDYQSPALSGSVSLDDLGAYTEDGRIAKAPEQAPALADLTGSLPVASLALDNLPVASTLSMTDFTPQDYEEQTARFPDAMNVISSPFDRPGAINLARPEVKDMVQMALTENRRAIGQGNLAAGQMPMEVAVNRALTGYDGFRGAHRPGVDLSDVSTQIHAPSQFSGMHNRAQLADSRRFAERNPDTIAELMGTAKGLLTGETAPVARGATRFDGPDAYGRITGPSYDFGGNRAWSIDPEAVAAYDTRRNGYADLNQGVIDSNPLFDQPAAAPETLGPRSELAPEAAPAPPGPSTGDVLAQALGITPARAEEAPPQSFEPNFDEAFSARPSYGTLSDMPIGDFSFASGFTPAAMPGPVDAMVGPAQFGSSNFSSSGIPAAIRSQDYESPRSRRHEVDAPPAGARIAGDGVVPSSGPAEKSPSRATAVAANTPSGAVSTGEVFGPVMPGMMPGTDRYPDRGVIAQPSTAFHEKIAERVGPAVAGSFGGGLAGLASTVSGALGGPSFGGVFANSTPGMDLSRSMAEPGDHDYRSIASAEPTKPMDSTKPGATGKSKATPVSTDDSWLRRIYHGAPADPTRYGYGGEREYFTYAARGGLQKAVTRQDKRPRGALMRSKREC